jgi:hypothetical protein
MNETQDQLTFSWLVCIRENLAGAAHRLHEISQVMNGLEQTGMYPAIPTEQWQDRDGKGKYLYMLFRQDRNGVYTGPDGKRKLYVGTDPEKIAEAHRLAANRRRWEELRAAARQLDIWLKARQGDMEHLARNCQQWPHTDLGLPVANVDQAASPNVELLGLNSDAARDRDEPNLPQFGASLGQT